MKRALMIFATVLISGCAQSPPVVVDEVVQSPANVRSPPAVVLPDCEYEKMPDGSWRINGCSEN